MQRAILQQDHDALSILSVDGESHDVAAAHSVDVILDRQLEILRPHIAAVDKDEILAASSDDEGAADEITKVAGVQPTVSREYAGSFLAAAEVFSHHTRAAKHDAATLTLGKNGSLRITDLQLVAGQHLTTLHQIAHMVAVRRDGTPVSSQTTQIDAIDLYPAVKRRKSDPESGFSHAIARDKSLLAETAAAKGIGESRQNPRADHVAADAGDAPARKIEMFQAGIHRSPGAQVIAERRTEREGAAVAGDERRPDERPAREFIGRKVVRR